MFECKPRYFFNFFLLVKRMILIPIQIIFFVLFVLNIFEILTIIPKNLYLNYNSPWMRLLTNFLFFGLIIGVIHFPFFLAEKILRIKHFKIYNNDCLKAINEAKLPKKLPKVLYIYTTHNDLLESRVIQNSKQTYQNLEVWVSDGSDKEEWKNKIKDFCNKNKINLFSLPLSGSKNKAHNINTFLKNYKGDYDFLMIGDADEVFHPNFVDHAVKMFYSDKVRNLAYVVPLNISYKSKGIISNTLRLIESISSFKCTKKSYSYSLLPDLAGQSALISRKYLIQCNKKEALDEGNLEDWYLESSIVENELFGIFLTSTPCCFEPDVSIKASISRIMRIVDWRIRWWKIRPKKIAKNFSGKYLYWYRETKIPLLRPFYFFIILFVLATSIWVFSNWWSYAFYKNNLFWIFIGFYSFCFIVYLAISIYSYRKLLFDFWVVFLLPLSITFIAFSFFIYTIIHWFKTMFLGKYSQFGGSGESRFSKKVKKPSTKWWIYFFIFSIIIVSFNVLMFTQTNWITLKWIVIYFNVFLGAIWFSCFSLLACWYINLIPYNKSFERNQFIDCKNTNDWF